jgi:hypothetical protein
MPGYQHKNDQDDLSWFCHTEYASCNSFATAARYAETIKIRSAVKRMEGNHGNGRDRLDGNRPATGAAGPRITGC